MGTNTLTAIFNGTAITSFAFGAPATANAVANVESVNADAGPHYGGGDTLTYAGTTAAIR